MRRTFPVHQVLARQINAYLASLLKHHRRRNRHLYMYPENLIGAIMASLAVIEVGALDRRAIKALLWHSKRWQKHRVVKTAPGVYELPMWFDHTEQVLRYRLRTMRL